MRYRVNRTRKNELRTDRVKDHPHAAKQTKTDRVEVPSASIAFTLRSDEGLSPS